MSYRPPTWCPRCRGRVVQTWLGEHPKCLACGWADYGMPLRVIDAAIPLELTGFEDYFEVATEELTLKEMEDERVD